MRLRRWCACCFIVCFALSEARAGDYRTDYDRYFEREARVYLPFFDWHYLRYQGIAESGLDRNARSPAGAVGLMQFEPATARELSINPLDPQSAIHGAAIYDRTLFNAWPQTATLPNRRDLMFASYNAGLGNIEKAARLAGKLIWAAVAAMLPRVTGKNAGQTVEYVKRINGMAGD
jgi:membrane-bound lytic murein transglycosylase F